MAKAILVNMDGGKGLVRKRVVTLPKKGDIILMNVDGEEKRYRVLEMDGSVAKVLAMWTFEDATYSLYDNYFKESDIDLFLNVKWFESLSESVKSAFASPDVFSQGTYTRISNPDPGETITYSYNSDRQYGIVKTDEELMPFSGDGGIYVPDLKDIYDYFDKTHLEAEDIKSFFPYKLSTDYFWLSSRDSTDEFLEWVANSSDVFYTAPINSMYLICPVFYINLSKIPYSILES